MTIGEITEILRNTKYFSKDDMRRELYEQFLTVRETLLNNDENSGRLLNNGNVTGVWYLTDMVYDGGAPQVIIRYGEAVNKMDSHKQLELDHELFEIIHNDVAFNYDKDLIKGDGMLIGLQQMLFSEIERGRVLTIFDKERDSVKKSST